MEGFVSTQLLVLRGGEVALHLQGQHDHHRHGQGWVDRPEDTRPRCLPPARRPVFCTQPSISRRFRPRPFARCSVVMLTQSGETAEVTQLLPSLREFGVPLVAITAARASSVGRAANVVIELGDSEEVCSLGLARARADSDVWRSATRRIGDEQMRNFQADDFAVSPSRLRVTQYRTSLTHAMSTTNSLIEYCRIPR